MSNKNVVLGLILNVLNGTNFRSVQDKLYSRKINKIKRKRMILLLNNKKKTRSIPKTKNFLKVIEEFPDDVFRNHFRMKKSTFQSVEIELCPLWKKFNLGRPKKSLRLALLLTIWKLANNCSFREISNLFDVSKGLAFKYFIEVTKIVFKLRKKYIKWPDSIEEQKFIMDKFASLRNNPFPNVLGCVDGTQIPITAPKEDPTSYFNRKGTYSINMQGVCDHNQKFIDVCFGYPGSCHDASVWESSSIGKALKTGSKRIIQDGHILGDSAYPLNCYLMVPFRDNGHLDSTQRTFNYIHSSTRVCVEQAFGRLKSMFRILKFIDIKKLEYAKCIVLACVVFHNIIIEQEKELQPYSSTDSENDLTNNSEEHQSTADAANYEAKVKRNGIAMILSS